MAKKNTLLFLKLRKPHGNNIFLWNKNYMHMNSLWF